jgi:hypothetical protein
MTVSRCATEVVHTRLYLRRWRADNRSVYARTTKRRGLHGDRRSVLSAASRSRRIGSFCSHRCKERPLPTARKQLIPHPRHHDRTRSHRQRQGLPLPRLAPNNHPPQNRAPLHTHPPCPHQRQSRTPHPTLLREWAYARSYQTSTARTRALNRYFRWYNRRRPHSSLGARTPISRVSHLCGHDI